jgi:cellulose synthase/poly-beta-1,6-N-acetylglucosamine synthase-like glycosyltransferase
MEALLKDVLVVAYVFVLLTVALYGFHRYILVYLYVKHRHNGYQPKARFDLLPRVTVQLPMYNEDTVAERIIASTCAIDTRSTSSQIQVLDDSTDHSADIAKARRRVGGQGLPDRVHPPRPTAKATRPARWRRAEVGQRRVHRASSTPTSSRLVTFFTTSSTTSPTTRSAWSRFAGTI